MQSTSNIDWAAAASQKLKDYGLLVKFKLNLTVVFSAVVAYLVALRGELSWSLLLILSLGGFFVTAAANALNEVLERDYDKLMKRTADRPIAAGRMSVSEAVLAAGLMSLVGISLLAWFNPMTAFLGTFSLISYAFVYTPMKRVSPIAVLIGAIPGALPTAIGCVAAEGTITPLAIALFGVQFFWQFPHFWAIAWLGHEDYTKAGFNLLPSRGGRLDSSVGFQAFLYSLPLFPLGYMPYAFERTGLVSVIIVMSVTVIFSYFAFIFYKKSDRESARKLMFASFFYLPIVLVTLLIDKI